jgi:hypothetical protein
MSLIKFLCTLTILLNSLDYGFSMEADDIGERFFKGTLSKHEQVNLNSHQILDCVLKECYLGDYKVINAGMEDFFYSLAARGWLTLTKGTPPGKTRATSFEIVTKYEITNEPEVKKYLQEHYKGIKYYLKFGLAGEEGLSGVESENDGEEQKFGFTSNCIT